MNYKDNFRQTLDEMQEKDLDATAQQIIYLGAIAEFLADIADSLKEVAKNANNSN